MQEEFLMVRLGMKIHRLSPDLMLYVMHGSVIHQLALEKEHPVVCEFYADRDYDHSGSIVFTRRMTPLDPQQVADKVLKACIEGRVTTVEGQEIPIEFDSICIHSDTPGALALVQATRQRLDATGITICAPPTGSIPQIVGASVKQQTNESR